MRQLAQGIHLVLHQRNKRRDYNGRSRADKRWHLVAQRFAGAGWHKHQRIVAGDQMFNNGLLLATKGIVTKNTFQDRQRGGGIRH